MKSFISFIIFLLIMPVVLLAGDFSTAPGAIWEFLSTFSTDHPLATVVISLIIGLVGQKGAPIIWFLLYLLKSVRDGLFDDTEAAGALWRLAGVINGFWPDKSRKFILQYAPRHWHEVILEGKDPTFQLVAVPLNKVGEIQNLLLQGGEEAPKNSEGG